MYRNLYLTLLFLFIVLLLSLPISAKPSFAQGDDSTVNSSTDPISSNFAYSDWSNWGNCSQSCGGGIQYRTRICDYLGHGNALNCGYCGGECSENRSCNTQPCSQSFSVECSADGGARNASTSFTVSGSDRQKDVTLFTGSTRRRGSFRIYFQASGSNIDISGFSAGPTTNGKQHMCFNPSLSNCARVSIGTAHPYNCSSPVTCRVRNNSSGQTWYTVAGREVSSSYVTSGSYMSSRERDNACFTSAEWNRARSDSGMPLPCYIWQSSCR